MATREEYLPALEWFTTQVDRKLNLPKNVAKAHWSDADSYFLLDLLEKEFYELQTEIDNFYGRHTFTDPEDSNETTRNEAIISECADVAAFAMMIADNHRR